MPGAIIFDLDGTLYDKSGLAGHLIRRALLQGRLGMLARERRARKELKGKSFGTEAAFYEALFARMSARPGRAARWYHGWYLPEMARQLRLHHRLRPWVQPLLEALAGQGIPVAVLSDYGAVREKLEALGLRPEAFRVVTDAPSCGGLKPCAAPFLAVAKALGVPPESCVVVGDRPDTDGAGARAAGMGFRLVRGDEPPSF